MEQLVLKMQKKIISGFKKAIQKGENWELLNCHFQDIIEIENLPLTKFDEY